MNPRLARRVNLPPMMIMMMDLIKNNLNTQQFSENLFGHWKNKIPAFYNIKLIVSLKGFFLKLGSDICILFLLHYFPQFR